MPSISRDNIRQIQHALSRRGFDPGVIDGIWGPRTAGAVRAFQRSADLVVDGIVGPRTWAALTDAPMGPGFSNSPAIPWFQEARRLIGIRERAGPGNEPVIIDWATRAGIDYGSDEIPWCGLFVAHCTSATLANEPLPANPLGAREWLKFGAPCEPVLGAILIFWRVRQSGWQGHVGFYAGEDPTGYHVLGGNQGNRVSITRIRQDRLLGARWPATAPMGATGPVVLAEGNSFFSTDEA